MRIKSFPHDITLDQWFDFWLTTYKHNIAQGTKTGYQVAYQYYSTTLGFREVRDLRQEDFYEMYLDMVECGHTSTTIKQTKMVMKQCLNKAVEEALICSNPVPARFISGIGATEKIVLNSKEVMDIVQYANEYEFAQKNIVLFLFSTGLRSGEIRGLTWNDVLFNEELIHVRTSLRDLYKQRKRTTIVNTPKTQKSKRFVPMTEEMKKTLMSMRIKKTFIDSETLSKYGELIFPIHGKEMSNNDIYYVFVKLVKEMNLNGYPMRKFTPQIGRRTFASLCFASGLDPKVISEVMGHESINTTLNYYIKPDNEFLSKEMKKLKNIGAKMAQTPHSN